MSSLEDRVSNPPVFNRGDFLNRLMGDENLAKSVIDTFLEDLPEQIRTLKELLEKNDRTGTHRQAHSIKGASINVGGNRL